jgi:hypothetical protein
MKGNLKLVKPAPSLEDEIRLALIQHKQALESVRWAEDELQPLRRRYAAWKGEYMLPSIERLRREVL